MGNREKASHLHRLPWAPLPRQKALPHGPAQARPGKPFSQRLANYSTGKLLSNSSVPPAAAAACSGKVNAGQPALRPGGEIGRASWRESGCQDVEISVVAVVFKKKTNHR